MFSVFHIKPCVIIIIQRKCTCTIVSSVLVRVCVFQSIGSVLVDLSENEVAFVLRPALFCQTYKSVVIARPLSLSLSLFLLTLSFSFLSLFPFILSFSFLSLSLSLFPSLLFIPPSFGSLPGKPTHLHNYMPIGRAQPGYWSCFKYQYSSLITIMHNKNF